MSQTNHHNSAGPASGSYRSYATGFVLSIILTVIPFALVMNASLSPIALIICIYAAATAQIFVQLRYFLHMDRSSAMYWNVMSFLFTVFIVVLFVGGSIWIMYELHYRM